MSSDFYFVVAFIFADMGNDSEIYSCLWFFEAVDPIPVFERRTNGVASFLAEP